MQTEWQNTETAALMQASKRTGYSQKRDAHEKLNFEYFPAGKLVTYVSESRSQILGNICRKLSEYPVDAISVKI